MTVQLLQNGTEVDGGTVTLSADNNWCCSFDNLPKYDDGSITITNQAKTTTGNNGSTDSTGGTGNGNSSGATGIGSPKTGDNSNIVTG